MNPFNSALVRASRGLDWSYPCLIWVADYLLEATGIDYALDWRGVVWTEESARRALARLAAGGRGESPVEKAIDVLANAVGWQDRDGPRQGAIMLGIFTDPDGVGFPAIYDGGKGWLVAFKGDATIVQQTPERMWEIAS